MLGVFLISVKLFLSYNCFPFFYVSINFCYSLFYLIVKNEVYLFVCLIVCFTFDHHTFVVYLRPDDTLLVESIMSCSSRPLLRATYMLSYKVLLAHGESKQFSTSLELNTGHFDCELSALTTRPGSYYHITL